MWFSKEKDTVFKELEVNPAIGLTTQEAQERLEKYGVNKLQGKSKKSLFRLFLEQLQDTLIYVLLAASAITVIIGEYADTAIILIVVIINAVVGVAQEYKAGKAVEALQDMTTPHAIVRRDGEIKEISSEEVVPGDIVILDAGRFVPADLRLYESVNLQIEESALTGESVPTNKDARAILAPGKTALGDMCNMAFMSTLVTYGRGEGVVTATAMETEMGKIAKILDEDNDDMTPLQKRMDELGKMLSKLCVGICLLMLVIAIIQGRDVFEMLLTSISLAVAAIPEGLAAIVAIVLALGVTRMSKINAIVKKMPAVETLGSVSIICSDKTGTLTQNKMTVVKTYTLSNAEAIAEAEISSPVAGDELELLKAMALCTDATYEKGESTGDPTEVALVVLGDKHGIKKSELAVQHKRVAENPFDSDRKLMSTLNVDGDHYRVNTKGAMDHLLNIVTHVLRKGEVVPMTDEIKAQYMAIENQMSDNALRVLGAAYKEVDSIIAPEEMEKDLILIGIVGMIDPPRLEVKDSIREAQQAGITLIMITGDHKNTAVAIAKELGIAQSLDQSITGSEIDEYTDEEFAENIKKYRVFSRVSPEHKVKIVRAFKAHGNIVSMTGDGVNDAPSLKFADIGVAMGITGTDVAKGAADMILTDDNFTTIVHAIEEGRNIYNNIKKAVTFLLSCNLGEVIAIFVAILLDMPVPLIATQILWVNLITDALPALALGVDPGDHDVMKMKPRDPKESFFAHGAGYRAIVGGVLIGTLTLAAFYFGLTEFGHGIFSDDIPERDLEYARTMAFVVLASSQLFYSISLRHDTKSIFQIGLFSNKYLIGAIVVGLILQMSVIEIDALAAVFKCVDLNRSDWQMVFVFACVPLIVNEIEKLITRLMSKSED
ncbi:MAG: cation-translocating P-type ATPase [Acholeplasmataceae bacterium]|nr:cation-translocating P-type ATPase [Acholeplasmataceae bacterium]